MSSDKNFEDIFKALADATRLKIIRFLLNGERCVCEIYPYVKRTQSTVSIQLKKLERAGTIASRRKGKYIFYRIKDKKILNIFRLMGYNKRKSVWKKTKICQP